MTFNQDVFTLLGIELNDIQLQQFKQYYEFLIEYNKMTNLTRITEIKEVYYKHFYDSLTIARLVDMKTIASLCDMGAGAGFPSIPLKIMFPHLKITIIDSLGKRITFLNELAKKLDLNNINLVHDRVEVFALKHQEVFDIVTARAFGHLRLILEMGIPMVKNKGFFIAPKGDHYHHEIDEANHAMSTLNVKLLKIDEFELPFEYGKRANILMTKEKHIKGFPRSYVLMTKKPL